MRKKLLAVFLSLVFVIGLCGCTQNNVKSNSSKQNVLDNNDSDSSAVSSEKNKSQNQKSKSINKKSSKKGTKSGAKNATKKIK